MERKEGATNIGWWLTTRGGRTIADLKEDEKGKKYVLMGDGNGGLEKVYAPKEEK